MRIVDLFSGAGGLTFGFYYKLIDGQFIKNDNCEIVFANEWDKAAAEAFKKNFPTINMINITAPSSPQYFSSGPFWNLLAY